MIAMPKLIPASAWSALSLAIARGNTAQVQHVIGENDLDVNAFLDSSSWMPLIMDVLLSLGFESEESRLPLLRYLLEKGANPNILCARGYNCLHIAVQQDRYLRALDLFLDYNADVNVADADGANIVYWAVQSWLLRPDVEDRVAHLRVLSKILRMGADLDQETRFGMCARKWLEHAAPDVRDLVARWQEAKPTVRPTFTVQPVFPTNLRYPEVAGRIWNELVPSTGPAATVQGELLRAVEQLRDESPHKAKGNMTSADRKAHRRMAVFVRDTLVTSGIFDPAEVQRIQVDTSALIKTRRQTDSAVFDHLVDQVCVFYRRNESPIPLQVKKARKS
jgi:hypothetical protein